MAFSKKFFKDNLDRLPIGPDGQPLDQEKRNLYAGLLALSKEIEDLQHSQQQLLQELRNVDSQIRRL